MQITIEEKHGGMLLRTYILEVCGISHKLLTKLKSYPDGILLDGKHVTVRARVAPKSVLELNFENRDGKRSYGECTVKMPEILYEDDYILVVNKPPHMPTHQSLNHHGDTLADAVEHYYSQKKISSLFRPITRLDKDTSGVVLISKDTHTAAIMSEAMKSGRIRKTYLALAEGIPCGDFTVEKAIRREKESIIKRIVCEDGDGQPAKTEFHPIADGNGISLMKVTPLTGRTHQIRVHSAHAGFPILGDELYGHPSPLIQRQALHAYKLDITLNDGTPLSFSADLPDDMRSVASALSHKNSKEHII